MRFEIYRDRRGAWRWRLVAGNNRVVADGCEGYKSRRNVVRAVARVWSGIIMGGAEVTELVDGRRGKRGEKR